MNKNGTKKKHHLMRLLAGLPLSVLYVLSDIVFFILYYIIRYRRRLVRDNLLCAFPEKSKQEIVGIEKAFYHNLCDIFIEAFKCLNISDEEMLRRVEIVNCELPERLAAEGKAIFMLLGHCGCWEWVQEVCTRYKAPKKNCEVYKHVENKYFSSLMHEIRSRWDTEQVEMTQTVRTMLKWHAEGEPFLCGFIQDQRPDTKAKDRLIFLNHMTYYAPGAEEIAKKINAALVYLDIEKTGRGHYRMTFKEMHPTAEECCTSPFPMSRTFWRMLEETVRRQPDIWLWSHNRWRKWDLDNSLADRIKNLFKKTKTTPMP